MELSSRAVLMGAALSLYLGFSFPVSAQPEQSCEEGACTLSYPAEFFTRYAPVTALDMVNNLPGFALDDGDNDTRGFGGAAGNIVINGARVSAKSETPSDILGRIPATDIERIDVIRGQVAGFDLRGQNVIANIIRSGDSASGAWSAGARTYQPDDNVYPFGELSYSTGLGESQVTVGLKGREFQSLVARRERVLGPDTLPIEQRFELSDEDGKDYSATVNASTRRGETQFSVNLAKSYFISEGGESSRRYPTDASAPFLLFQGDSDRFIRDEFGFDIERALAADWRGKVIALFRDEDITRSGSLVRGPLDQPGTTEVTTRAKSLGEELIGRVELDYVGFEGHAIEINFEASNNSLESDFGFSALEDGQLTPQPVPGAKTTVEEERFDLLVSDSFQWGALSIDASLSAETSTITQVGGFTEDRSFFFWKPSLNLSYSPDDNSQWRVRALREVGQLDFEDFVSGADLGDAELALGNPNLSPETTMTMDLTYEIRGDDFGIGTVTLFHDWIDDVNDLLPLSGRLEVPGNIGSATRAGISGELTLPLDAIGLKNGRIDAAAEWQTSRVDDPLTGAIRALSDERQWTGRISIRQDLVAQRLAWGVLMFSRDSFPLYGLDEIDIQGQRADMDVFVETRAIAGLRIRLSVEDVFRDGEDRDRRVFAGDRSTSPLAFREVREQSQARIISLQVSGDF
ncbi:TonB-dependent receptor [Congregibacter brevis]|uniref:TonB-dependent receptor n=1 Tax=Congregibacter brevis TaxID=3081201 RepID=A0ABZ0IDI9_9GAMM|nr:TonB-dependent receptor [Congregibacter sp. IMCC45268]